MFQIFEMLNRMQESVYQKDEDEDDGEGRAWGKRGRKKGKNERWKE